MSSAMTHGTTSPATAELLPYIPTSERGKPHPMCVELDMGAVLSHADKRRKDPNHKLVFTLHVFNRRGRAVTHLTVEGNIIPKEDEVGKWLLEATVTDVKGLLDGIRVFHAGQELEGEFNLITGGSVSIARNIAMNYGNVA
ncbi:MAG: hypothetical protein JWL85_521 [Candidatus Saccharibacteria bacterium]|nr:hypothetical protein [Candidatus Saccharibacteria bacterium]